jgi:hypothetical protein
MTQSSPNSQLSGYSSTEDASAPHGISTATNLRWRWAQMHKQVRPWDKRLNADKNSLLKNKFISDRLTANENLLYARDEQKEFTELILSKVILFQTLNLVNPECTEEFGRNPSRGTACFLKSSINPLISSGSGAIKHIRTPLRT